MTATKARPTRRREQFMLPDGTCTSSTDRYVREWRRLAKDVGSVMGLVAHSWDPDLRMVPATGPMPTPMVMPLPVALKIQAMQKRIRELEHWNDLHIKCSLQKAV